MALDPDDLLALFAAFGALLAFAALMLAVGQMAQRRYRRRLKALYDRANGGGAPVAAATQSLARVQSATPNIDRVARRWLPRREILAARLARTGRAISIGQYALTMVGVTGAAAAATIVLTSIRTVPALLIGLFLGMGFPYLAVSRLGNRRVRAFTELFPDAIDLMVRALRSGLPISEAIVGAGQEIADPVGCELRLVENGMRLGRDLEALLWDIAKRIDTPEFRFFIIALSVQRETGGNLAETLANLAEALRRRRQMRAKVRAMSSETRATTMILGGLPVVVIGLLMLTSPDYLRPLLHDPRGHVLCGIALAMLVSGVTIMNKMARFDI
ncbi:MAG TPA: type II secretion system F family protein [Stellaceae bacterium]|jgi:tight adherence protein B|nr:type II secretion system F family protein [Stellaceae bacterium]